MAAITTGSLPLPEHAMDRTTPSSAQTRIAEPHLDFFPLASLPEDVLPNIFSRLPDSGLFALPSVCRQFLHATRPVLRDRAARALHEALAFQGEQRWTRVLDVLRKYSAGIEDREWRAFLQTVEAQDQGSAALMQLALLAPAVSKGNASLRQRTQSLPLNLDESAIAKFRKLVKGAQTDPWMGRITGAVIAGRWQQTLVDNRTTGAACTQMQRDRHLFRDWSDVIDQLIKLPLANQMQALPQLASRPNDTLNLWTTFNHFRQTHLLHMAASNVKSPRQMLGVVEAAAYFNMLNSAYGLSQNAGEADTLGQKFIKRDMHLLVSRWLQDGMPVGPWREEASEVALCLFYILGWGRTENTTRAQFGKQLIDAGFITRRECADFNRHVPEQRGSFYKDVQAWVARNRMLPADERPAPSCTVS